MKISNDKVVSLTYELNIKDEAGEHTLLETADMEQPMVFLFGGSGLPEKFEEQLDGMNEGDTFDFTLHSEHGYGDYNEEAVVPLPKNIFKIDGEIVEDMLKPGNIIPMADQEGNPIDGQVVEVKDDVVIVDFNHPLAGKDLHFKGKVVSVREATQEELEHGHVHGEGGHQH